MGKPQWLLSAALIGLSAPAAARDSASAPPPSSAEADAAAAEAGAAVSAGDIIVTATRRASPLADVPIAVSAITADALQNSGATDTRQLNQITPSLLVSSTQSEAGAGGARIRGIGTVGDNAGLESSVATFIDGVYRNRSGVGLTELGPVERVEVLRGPQGTLFGRNASAGLINVVTARPKFDEEGYAEASYGNYDYYRLGLGFTGPIGDKIAYRLDGVKVKRDGFLKDVISGRDVNDRDRWLVRGKLLFEPSDDVSFLLVADYADRDEECCAGVFQPTRTVVRNPDGTLRFLPSTVAAAERAIVSVVPGSGNGQILEDTYARRVALTPGRTYRSDVRDMGISGELNWDLGGAKLTSITAYRDWRYIRGQDSDFNNLDIFRRADDGSNRTRFKTFTQELRLQGSAFNDKLDWLVGGYFADEDLTLDDNLSFGADTDAFATSLIRLGSPALAAFPGFPALRPFITAFLAQQGLPPQASGPITSLVPNLSLSSYLTQDKFKQNSRNYALFTHNIFNITDRLSLTLGARYTNERKKLSADLASSSQCGTYLQSVAALQAFAANTANPAPLRGAAAGVATNMAQLATLPCAINSVNGSFSGGKRKESEWSSTAVLSYKPTDQLLTYVSYSRGYKAGGFNLDRAGLTFTRVNLNDLQFQPEKVDSFEVGAKFNERQFDINVAGFYAIYETFQLNTFNGVNFVVENIEACSTDLGGADTDSSNATGACPGKRKGGVTSKGVEVEAALKPHPDFNVTAGVTYADTKYRHNLVGANGRPLTSALFQLPGRRLSNSSQVVVTGSAGWTPPLGSGGLTGLVYADFRYQSALNTGSDLDIEKFQPAVMVVNARLGVAGRDKAWSVEFWAQNLFDVDYRQITFDGSLQGSGTTRATQAFGTPATQLYGAFLAEPRTYGVTVRSKF